MFVDIVLSGLVFFGGFIAIAVVVKLRERNRALKWPGVPGQVISGTASAQDVTTHAGIDDERDQVETRNFARIAYRYSVNGKRYTGKRVSIGDDMGNGDIAGLLKKYPRGKVVEVFYDPADPARAVLERDLPEGCGKAALLALGIVIALVAIGFALDHGVAALTARLKDADKAFMIAFLGAFGAVALYIAATIWENARAVRKWPRAKGKMLAADVTAGPAPILYSYTVAGVTYRSDMVDRVRTTGRPTECKLASGQVLRGGVPAEFDVFYNPADPTQACLSSRTPGLIALPLAMAAFVAGLAWLVWAG